ncbi:MAG: cytochrome c-type biogenesis protein CcmH [Gammaproteobacteria bacterium]|nr:cytochrome c-type biogenesis protein CcmH [Gammaproteobacteria bacterium]
MQTQPHSRLRRLSLGALLLMLAGVSHAIDPTPPLADAALQARYEAITHELRCMQCQNQSIADSQVGLAADLRREVRTLLVEGKSDADIRDHMVARYGDFILFRPRMNARTAWLWLAPFVLLAIGAVVAVRVLRKRAQLVDADAQVIDRFDGTDDT